MGLGNYEDWGFSTILLFSFILVQGLLILFHEIITVVFIVYRHYAISCADFGELIQQGALLASWEALANFPLSICYYAPALSDLTGEE